MAKKKILLLSDDLRMSSGVGTMSKEFVIGTIHHYDWVQAGGAIKHPEKGKIVDMNKTIKISKMILYEFLGEWDVLLFTPTTFLTQFQRFSTC